MGVNLGILLSLFHPSLAGVAVTAGILGSILPDLDMMAEHHRTLHRPFQFLVITAAFYTIFWFTNSTFSAFLFFGVGAATVHSFSDILSQGKTKHPEVSKDDRAVFNHLAGEWMEPKRLVNEGSRRDLFMTFVLAVPPFMFLKGFFVYFTALAVIFGSTQFYLRDWFTKEYLSEYDRYSEFFQHKIGFGPEIGTGLQVRNLPAISRKLLFNLVVPFRDRINS